MKNPKKKISLPQHHTSIDTLPILSWERIHEKRDMIHLLIKPVKLTKAQKIELVKVWDAIYDEYLKVFGFGEALQAINKKRIEIYRLTALYLATRDKSHLNFINKKETELKKLMQAQNGSKGNIYEAKIRMEQILKIYLPIKDLSVREFYTYDANLKKINQNAGR